MESLGEKLEGVLVEIEDTLWEKEANLPDVPHDFNNNGFRAACKIFMAASLDYLWKDSNDKNYTQKQREDRALALGTRIKQLVFEFTGRDTTAMYKNKDY